MILNPNKTRVERLEPSCLNERLDIEHFININSIFFRIIDDCPEMLAGPYKLSVIRSDPDALLEPFAFVYVAVIEIYTIDLSGQIVNVIGSVHD